MTAAGRLRAFLIDDEPLALRRLARLLAATGRVEVVRGAGFLDRLASRVGDRVHLVPVEQVTHVFARDRATYAAAGGGELLLDTTLTDLEGRLDPARFVRVHRQALVNVGWIAELHAHFGGRLLIRLRDPGRTELVAARDRVRALKERLGLLQTRARPGSADGMPADWAGAAGCRRRGQAGRPRSRPRA